MHLSSPSANLTITAYKESFPFGRLSFFVVNGGCPLIGHLHNRAVSAFKDDLAFARVRFAAGENQPLPGMQSVCEDALYYI